MNNCLLCHETISNTFGWREFLGLGKEKRICTSCSVQFSRISGEVCVKCGRLWLDVPLEHRHDTSCTDCVKWEQDKEYSGALSCNRSVFSYNEFMKEVLARYKFRGDAVIATIFQDELRQAFQHFQKGNYVIVPIPLSEERLYERGFNQSLLLAQLLQGEIVEVLCKKEAEKQSKKARMERIDAENQFFVSNEETVKNRRFLLIDDIYTTGTTIRMAAKRLKEAGAGEISSLTLIRS
ncbi:ComF family protein [Sutcliffiella halmapala]|uniref:ComF family protein n=1 Tax=Sutcliffiella halmapala TaxID=79882 RepID=UPI001116AF6F|nr:ComF family protein [Sutcliffiella halmapala]